jgi:cobalt/nickel transport system permease protein
MAAALVAAEAGLVLGALGVVCETTLSGISELPFRPFLAAMVPIHLAIGLVEGLATAAVLGFVLKVRPDVVDPASSPAPTFTSRLGAAFLAAALLLGGVVSWFASKRPDGLEWSIAKVSGHAAPAEADASRGATSLAGIGGGLVTLGAVSAAGWALRRRS